MLRIIFCVIQFATNKLEAKKYISIKNNSPSHSQFVKVIIPYLLPRISQDTKLTEWILFSIDMNLNEIKIDLLEQNKSALRFYMNFKDI